MFDADVLSGLYLFIRCKSTGLSQMIMWGIRRGKNMKGLKETWNNYNAGLFSAIM